MSDSIKSFLSEAASTALDEAREDLRIAKQEVSQLSFAVREVSSECTQLRKELTRMTGECQSIDARAKEKGEALKLIEKLKQELQTKIAAAWKVD